MERKLDLDRVHDLAHRLWYQVTMGLTDGTPGRGAPAGNLEGTIIALKEVLPLLENYQKDVDVQKEAQPG
jgi:hypothetical protein